MNRIISRLVVLAALAGVSAGSLFAAPEGGDLLRNGDFQKGCDAWTLRDESPGTQKTLTVANDGPGGKPAATISVISVEDKSGSAQIVLSQSGFTFSKGKTYRLSFMVKGSGQPGMGFVLRSSAVGWPSDIPEGSQRHIDLKPDWQRINHDFTPSKDETNAVLYFSEVSRAGSVVSLADMSLKELAK